MTIDRRAILQRLLLSLSIAVGGLAQLAAQTYEQEHTRGLDDLSGGRFAEAIVHFQRCLELVPGDDDATYNIACAHAKSGAIDAGLLWIQNWFDAGFCDPDLLRGDPDLGALREDPRFAELLVVADELFANQLLEQAARREQQARAFRQNIAQTDAITQRSPVVWQDGHTGDRIVGIRFSPDGDNVLTWGNDSLMIVWNARTGEYVGQLGRQAGRNSVLAEFSADGERILVHDQASGRVTLWDGRSTEFVAELGGGDAVHLHAIFSPDGAQVATAASGGRIEIWDAFTGDRYPRPVIESGPVGGNLVTNLQYGAEGSVLLTIGLDRRARLFDARSGDLLAVFGKSGAGIDRVRFSADGQRIVAWSPDAGNVRVYDVERPDEPLLARRHHYQGGDRTLSPDGRLLATRSLRADGEQFTVWDVDQGTAVFTLERHPGQGRIAFHPDGTRIGTSDQGGVRLWSTVDGALIATHETVKLPTAILEFSPDGRWLVIRHGRSGVMLHVCDARSLVSRANVGFPGTIYSAAFDRDTTQVGAVSFMTGAGVLDIGRHRWTPLETHARVPLATGVGPNGRIVSARLVSRSENQGVPVDDWHPGSLDRTERIGLPQGSAGEARLGSEFGSSGRYLLGNARAGVHVPSWQVCELGRDRPLAAFDDGSRYVGVRFGLDGERFVATSAFSEQPRRGQVTLRGIDATRIARFAVGVPAFDTETPIAVFDPSGRWICNGAHVPRGRIEIRDARTGEMSHPLDGHRDLPRTFAFAPDGKVLLSTSFDGSVRLWSCETFEALRDPIERGSTPFCAAFSPDGERFVFGCDDGSAAIARTSDPDDLVELEGHVDRVRHVVFAADGARVVTCSDDDTARIWDVASGTPLHVLRGHTGEVHWAAFLRGGTRVVTQSNDATTRIWDATDGQLVVTRVVYASGNWLAFTPDGYYTGTEQAAEWAHVMVRGRSYPLSSYAAFLRKPDLVRKFIAREDVPEPKRLQPAPEIDRIAPRAQSAMSTSRSFRFEVSVDDRYGVESIEVEQDGTVIDREVVAAATTRSRRGRDYRAYVSLQLRIPAGQGETTVRIRASSRSQVRSRPHQVVVRYEAPRSDLYVLALAVQDYDDDALDLNSAVKDADDLIAALQKQEEVLYDEVKVHRLVDDEVTRGAVVRARKKFLAEADREDTIVVFVAGHGVLDDEDQYWFLTADATVDDPFDAVDRATLDSLVKSKKLVARKRVMLIDTCHSGTDVEGARGGDRGVRRKHARELVRDGGGGIYVLAASTDTGFAKERDGNGLFTKALLDGLEGGADKNGDGFVAVMELLQWTHDRVREASNGRQEPTLPTVESGENFPLFRVR